MSKFKVGDTVKVIKSGSGIALSNLGLTTIITEINGTYGNTGRSSVKTKDFKNPPYSGWIGEESFELVIGDWDT